MPPETKADNETSLETLTSIFVSRCEQTPERPAYAFVRDTLALAESANYAELFQQVCRVADALVRHTQFGDRVLLIYPPGLDFVRAFWACVITGRIAVPVPAPDAARFKNSAPRLLTILQDASASALMTNRDLSEAAQSLQDMNSGSTQTILCTSLDTLPPAPVRPELPSDSQKVTPDTIAYLQYTSGSTSAPRGVILTHANISAQCRSGIQALAMNADSRVLTWLPHHHDYGLVLGVLWPLGTGIPSYLLSSLTFLRRPLRWLEAIGHFGATHTGGPNFAYAACVRAAQQQPDWQGNLSSLRSVSCGAEPIQLSTLDAFATCFQPHGLSPTVLMPSYGMAETVLGITTSVMNRGYHAQTLHVPSLETHYVKRLPKGTPDTREIVGCGVALDGMEMRIVDPQTRQALSDDAVGEIWVRGTSVGRGYWEQPEPTEHTFHAHLASGEGPFLRTGDLGFLDSGEVYITGRIKDLIIVRGRNLYPQDLEWTAQSTDSALRVGYGAAISIEGPDGEEVVIVQEVERRENGKDLAQITATISKAIANEYELPLHAIVLVQAGSLPRTSSGKIRRRSCRQDFLNGSLTVLHSNTAPPPDALTPDAVPAVANPRALVNAGERLHAVEKRLLHWVAHHTRRATTSLSLDASAIECGLDSLSCFRVHQALETELQCSLPASCVLAGPDLRTVAQRIDATLDDAASHEDAAFTPTAVSRQALMPLSAAQLRMWFWQELVPDTALYNVTVALKLEGPLDAHVLQDCLGALIQRHEILRMRWVRSDGMQRQRIEPFTDWRMHQVTLEPRTGASPQEQTDTFVAEEARRPFDLTLESAVRATLLQRSAQEHLLVWSLHHSVCDGQSLRVMMDELCQLYAARLANKPDPLPHAGLQFLDYAAWETDMLARGARTLELAYWKQQLAEAPGFLELPTDRPRPSQQRFRGATWPVRLSVERTTQLQALAKSADVTLFMLLFAALQTLLHRYSGQDTIVTASVIANRDRAEFDRTVGYFANTLALRTDFSDDLTVAGLLAQVKRHALGAFAHHRVPFEEVVDALDLPRDPSRTPLVQTAFVLQPAMPAEYTLGPVVGREIPVLSPNAKFDLSLELRENRNGLEGNFEYDSDLFDASTVERMASHLLRLLDGLCTRPQERVSALPMVDEEERRQLTGHGMGTVQPYPLGVPIHIRIEQQVATTPQAPAASFDGQSLDYATLNIQANRLARRLRQLGVGPGVPVGICMERSLEMPVAFLAVLKAAGAFVPLDPQLSPERLSYLLQDTNARTVLTQSHLKTRVSDAARTPTCLCVDTLLPTLQSEDSANLQAAVGPDDLAYVVYTSGSTGQPKGVMVPHSALCNLMYWTQETLRIGAGDRMLQMITIGFDPAVVDLLLPLMAGATTVLARPGDQKEAASLVRTLQAERISHVMMVPSQLTVLLNEPGLEDCHRLRYVVSGGEALSTDLARKFRSKLPDTTLGNFYGPTEATVTATYAEARTDQLSAATVPIGRAIANTQCLVLDAARQWVPIGVVGELHIAGAGLALGYLNQPELTAERFPAHPFEHGQRVYRTGDRVRLLSDGQLEYLGRIDTQVKLRGVRIELGEVEAALNAHPSVTQAVAVVREDTPGLKRLVAYVVGTAIDMVELAQSLKQQLPDVMVPTAFMALEQLPTLPSGKVHRAALPRPDVALERAYVAPVGNTESRIAAIWAELLGVPRVGRHDSFFELGGHSLLAMQALSRMRQSLGFELPLRTLFDTPTVGQLAQDIAGNASAQPALRIPKASTNASTLLTAAQQGMWFAEKLQQLSAQYNIPQATRLRGPLDLPALERSLQVLCERHALLRSHVVEHNGVPTLVQTNGARWPLQRLELPPHDANQHERVVLLALSDFARQAIDLGQAPLARAGVISVDEREHVVVLVLHHIAADGWSLDVLLQELAKEYGTQRAQTPSNLPTLALDWQDIAQWEHARLASDALTPSMNYWREKLRDLQPLRLPPELADVPVVPAATSLEGMTLPPLLVKDIEALASKHNASVFMVLLTALQLLLMRRTGQQDVAVGTPVVGRDSAELEPVVGPLLNTLVLRSNLGGNPSFEALLEQVRGTVLDAWTHQAIPFDRLVVELAPQREVDRSPFFDVLINAVGRWDDALRLPDMVSEAIQLAPAAPKFTLTLYVQAKPGQINLEASYRVDRLCAPAVRQLLEQLTSLLQQATQHPSMPLGAFSLLTPSARAMLSDPATALPPPAFTPILDQVFAQARQRPQQIAIRSAQRQHSYAELEEAVRTLAMRFQQIGVHRGDVVAISGPPCFGVVASMLATLMNGAVFLTLDPTLPLQRKRAMLSHCKVRALCLAGDTSSDAQTYADLGMHATLRLHPQLDGLPLLEAIDGLAMEPPQVDADAPAYIFFTSGSTGTPKAVLGRHRGLSHFIDWQRATFEITAQDRMSHLVGLSFDPVLRDILLPMTSGATLCIPEDRDLLDPVNWLARESITVVHTTPSVMQSWLHSTQQTGPLTKLRWLFAAGEPLHDTLLNQWRERCGTHARIVNLYGPTETTMARCFHVVEDPPRAGIQPVGHALPDSQVLVLNTAGERCGVGETGEIVLRTPLRSLGYLNLPEENQRRFRTNPWSTANQASEAADDLLYFTGDLGRFRHDGVLEIAGRLDDQMKIRGVRVEPAEVAAVLARHPAVQQCVVVPRLDDSGQPMLVAYVVPKSGQQMLARDIRSSLASQLPEAFIPGAIVPLASLPMQANGKVDRARLPQPDPDNRGSDNAVITPRTAIEQTLWDIWRSVLRAESFGVFENFFELGGHSLLATQVVSRIRDMLEFELPLRAIFETPTIASLAETVERGIQVRKGHAVSLPPVARVPRGGLLPTSYSQRRMWLVQQVNPETTAYNMPFALRLRGPLDGAVMEASLQRLTERHEAFRTTLVSIDGEPMQRIGPVERLALEHVSLSHRPPEERESDTAQLLNQRSAQVYDLTQGPLHRPTLVKLDDQDHVLYWSVHHAIGDGWSAGILMREMAAIYPALKRGHEPVLEPLLIDFADYATWQRQVMNSEALAGQLTFWKQTLAGLEPLPLPIDHARRSTQRGQGARLFGMCKPGTLVALKTLAAEHSATPYMVLLACFQSLLGRYCGVEDVAIGTPIANRTHVTSEHLIGTLVNTVVMRTDLSGNPTFVELLNRVRETALQAYAHQDLPFEALVEALVKHRTSDTSPLVQVLFNVLTQPQPALPIEDLAYEAFPFETGSTQFDLTLSIDAHLTGRVVLSYASELFDATTVERMLNSFIALVEQAISAPLQTVASFALVGEQDLQRLHDWNNTQAGLPIDTTVHALLDRQALQSPQAPALEQPGASALSYHELELRSNGLAHALRARGIGRGDLVGLCVERSTDMVVAQLAILKSGAAYVPLDPAYPADRLAYMAEDAQLALLVTESALVHALEWPRARALVLDIDVASIASQPDTPLAEDPQRDARPQDPAYVIYTSGSTGKPKGVVVHHRAAVNFLLSMARTPGLTAQDTLVAVTTLSFDIAVLELLLPLSVGARVVLASREQTLNGTALRSLVERSGATAMQATPSTWRVLIDAGWQGTPAFKALIGGEGLPQDLSAQLMARTGELWNMYGPTETTVWSTCWKVQASPDGISIGTPINNTTVRILDTRGQQCPIGVPGEIYIGGDGVTLGYLRRPELTAERFIPDPVAPGNRLYRTGDRGRWRHDGLLEHQGRLDFQVKVRGHRIELGEIESQLASHSSVARTVVIVREDSPGDQRLVAYLLPHGAMPEVHTLREYLRTSLPDYMVPQYFVAMEAIPLLPNGKIDRNSLPQPQATTNQQAQGRPAQPPTSSAEIAIATVWQRLLGIEQIGLSDNFFDLGGHSLLAIRAVNDIKKLTGANLSVRQLVFDNLGQIASQVSPATSQVGAEPLAPNETEDAAASVNRGFIKRLFDRFSS